MALTQQQKVFVSAYVIKFNATEAAVEAGYAESSVKSLLENADVLEAIDALVKARCEVLLLNGDVILQEMLETAREARRAGEFNAAIMAFREIGKGFGLFGHGNKGKGAGIGMLQINFGERSAIDVQTDGVALSSLTSPAGKPAVLLGKDRCLPGPSE